LPKEDGMLGCNAIPIEGKVEATFLAGTWENEYVKEEGNGSSSTLFLTRSSSLPTRTVG